MELSAQRTLSAPTELEARCADPTSRRVITNLPSDSRRTALAVDASRVLLSEQSRMISSLGQITGFAPASTGRVSSQMWSAPARASASASVDFPAPDAPRNAIALP